MRSVRAHSAHRFAHRMYAVGRHAVPIFGSTLCSLLDLQHSDPVMYCLSLLNRGRCILAAQGECGHGGSGPAVHQEAEVATGIQRWT